jgi:cell division septal protein FtsQ
MAARTAPKKRTKPHYVRNSKRKAVDAPVVAQRTVVVVLTLCLLVCFFVGLVFGFKWVRRQLFSKNPRFEIQHLEITCDGKLREEQVREYSGLREGMNLFGLSFDEIQNELLKSPLVESVTIERHLPSTLSVSVKERMPVARIMLGHYNVPRLIDRYGVVLPPRMSAELARLPLIKGMEETVQPGKETGNRDVECALEIVALCESKKYLHTYIPLESLDIKYEDFIDMRLTGGARVRMPRFQLESKLYYLASVIEFSRAQGKRVKEIDLTLESEKAPVRYY